MKKVISLVLMALMLCSMFSIYSAAATPDSTQKIAEAAYGTPVIDGQVDQVWSKATEYKIEGVYVKDDITTSTATFKVLWDENYLYILHNVKDNTFGNADWEAQSVGGNLWKRDGVSYTFSPDYNRDVTTTQVAPAFWFVIGAFGHTANFNTVDSKVFIGEEGNKNYAMSYPADGYIIELKVDLKARYEAFKLEAGVCIGFDTYTNDNNATLLSTTRNFGLYWNDKMTSYKDNSKKGTIVLAAKTAATTTTSSSTTTKPATTTAPKTSDASYIMIAASLIALTTVAFVAKKRRSSEI